ncbi:MAG: hypothetical protein ACP5XB_04940 [Isosphaeraceae bacterium]
MRRLPHIVAAGALLIGVTGRGLGQDTPPETGTARGGASLSFMLDRLRVGLERLRTIDYKAKVTRRQHMNKVTNPQKPSEKPYRISYDLEYTADGNRFHSRVKFRGIDGRLYDEELAYNGRYFQRFGQDSGLLELSKNIRMDQPAQSLMIQPVVFPFAFALGDGDQADYPTLINQNVWDRLAQQTAVRGEEESNGRATVVIEVATTRMGRPFRYKVYLDKGKDFYPIKSIAKATHGRSETDIRTTTIKTANGPVVVPLKIDEMDYDSSGRLMSTTSFQIEPAALKVNSPVDSKIFTIDPKRAWNGILDEEKNIRTRSPGAVAAGNRRGGWWVWWVLIPVNVAGASIIMVVRKILRSGST